MRDYLDLWRFLGVRWDDEAVLSVPASDLVPGLHAAGRQILDVQHKRDSVRVFASAEPDCPPGWPGHRRGFSAYVFHPEARVRVLTESARRTPPLVNAHWLGDRWEIIRDDNR